MGVITTSLLPIFFLIQPQNTVLGYETVLTAEDFKYARDLPDTEDGDNGLLERQGYFEGDLKMKQTTRAVQRDATSFFLGILPLISRYSLWQDGRIPYTISSSYSRYQRGVIAKAMQEYEDQTCIRFVPREGDERDYVYIFKDDGCYSLVGRVRGRQELSLDDDCVRKGVVIHELMHTVGFFHEQSRYDRDDYVNIRYNNIIPGTEDQFQKYKASKIDSLGVGYDYGSVLHYGPTAFSKNGRATIVPKDHGVRIGQRRGFSDKDVAKINTLYKCPQNQFRQAQSFKPDPPPRSQESTSPPFGFSRPPAAAPCKDIATNCNFFQDRCFKPSIRNYCQKTCGDCPSSPSGFFKIETSTPGFRPGAHLRRPGCEDEISTKDCEVLARQDHCKVSKFRTYMKKYCCRTCGF